MITVGSLWLNILHLTILNTLTSDAVSKQQHDVLEKQYDGLLMDAMNTPALYPRFIQ